MTIKNIPVGYKDSPLGIIPQDWEVKRFRDIGNFLRNNTLSRDKMSESEGCIQNIHYGDILIKYKEILKVSKTNIPWIVEDRKYSPLGDMLQNGDIVISDTAEDYTVGKATELMEINGAFVVAGLHTMPFRPLSDLFSPRFLGYYLNSMAYRFQLYALVQGIKVCSISKKAMSGTFLIVPPLAEQKKIAEILSTWDKAIEKQTQLIQKLELRKKGLMQQLLTGKKRLPGFTGEWEKVKLGEVTTFLSCNTFSREQMNNVCGNWKNVHYGDILVKYSSIVDISRDKDSIPYVNDTIEYSPKDYVASGDIVMADTAEDEMVGRACEFTNVGEEKIISGLHTILIRPIILFAPIFLGYYLNSREYHKQILSIMQGIKVYSITKEALKNTTIKYPDIQEQTAIANILSSCDEEIRLAQDKLAAMKEQKKGFMQVLLTGKKRVKI